VLVAATTVRLSVELGEQLDRYCMATGAVKNRVIALALRSYLGEEGVPALPGARVFDEPVELPEREQEILRGLRQDLDAREVSR
jgi:hypothetical protein